MTGAEMQELEKAALEDPFLADALEGYAYNLAPAGDLHDLHEAIEGRIKEKHRSVVPIGKPNLLLRVAAMIIVVAGLGWATRTAPRKNRQRSPAKSETCRGSKGYI
jgi:hypothetical protein